ncbi:hypothetical protein K474DRAFT_100384 [Panus rudis PR-1116 ss-1]|nr:hypothetical protein K474DRAFT_100384 [Panus rudis PR-1116 ss-1]
MVFSSVFTQSLCLSSTHDPSTTSSDMSEGQVWLCTLMLLSDGIRCEESLQDQTMPCLLGEIAIKNTEADLRTKSATSGFRPLNNR